MRRYELHIELFLPLGTGGGFWIFVQMLCVLCLVLSHFCLNLGSLFYSYGVGFVRLVIV